VQYPFGGNKPWEPGPMTLKKTLEEMQGGLLLIMDAVKKGNTQEAERLLLIVGGLLDRALRAERLK
jgi:hypothetical protein